MSSDTLFLHHRLVGIPLSFFKLTFEGRQGLWNKEQLFFGFCCFVLGFFYLCETFFVYIPSLYLPLCLFLGQVHATDYSNASATGIFDSYQVCSRLVLVLLSVFHQSEFIFYLITAMWLLFTDVLEPVPLLFGVSTSIYIPQSGKYRVSGIF